MQFSYLKKYKSWLTSAVITVLIAAWLMSGQVESESMEPVATTQTGDTTQQKTKVRVRQQAAEQITRTITVNGRTAPARIVELNAETDGRIDTVGVDRGDRLNQGEIIAKLDERDRQARLKQSIATVKQRELEFEARQKLKGDSYVSDAQLQEAAALLEAARAEKTRAELDMEYMTISAPFDGALQDRMVEIGDFVKRGDPIASYVDDRTLIVTASISEYDAHFVIKGNPGSAKLATGEVVNGVIRYVAPMADEATRTFTVELEVDNKDGLYRAGMTAELLIPAETILAQKVSPSLLTLDEQGNLGVKTINSAGMVEFHKADVALTSSDGVWIAGLPRSATIITVGQGFVNEGAIVDAISETDIDTAVAIKAGSQEN